MRTAAVLILVGIAIGFVGAIGLGFAAQAELNANVILALVTLTVTTWFGLWQFDKTKRKEADARIFAQRAEIYHRFVVTLRDILFSEKGWAPKKSQAELTKEMSNITFDMIVWGGQDTIRKMKSMSEQDTPDVGETLRRMSELYRAIRKDLGHSDDSTLSDDIVLTMLLPEERQSSLEKMRPGISQRS